MTRQTKSILNLDSLIDPDQTSDILGISPGTLQVWRSTGRYNLPYVKVGGRVMYRQVDVKTFIEKRMHNHTGDIAQGGA